MPYSLKEMRLLANTGSCAAQIQLGHACLIGVDLEGNTFPPNYSEAMHWLQCAHERQASTATYLLGTMYEDGKGTVADIGKAIDLYEMAVERGAYLPCLNLARIYASGKGVTQSMILAEKWYRKALSFENEVDDVDGLQEARLFVTQN
jgi:localization factor PodJL